MFQRNPLPLRMHAGAFRCIADSGHAHPFPRDETLFTQVLQGVAASVISSDRGRRGNGESVATTVISSDHAQAGRAVVHGVELGVVGKDLLIFQSSLSYFSPFTQALKK